MRTVQSLAEFRAAAAEAKRGKASTWSKSMAEAILYSKVHCSVGGGDGASVY